MNPFRRKKIAAVRPVLPPEPLGPDLYEHLVRELQSLPPEDRGNVRWVMSFDWLTDCLKLDYQPSYLFYSRPVSEPVTLLGLPIEVRSDGGIPRLEIVTP